MGTGRRLLLADDSITIQKVVNLTFADEGLEVTAVGNGDLAIEKIQEVEPDIVLADVHMPGLNGYEVCEFVKRNERFQHIPVMLLVGSFEPFNEAEARRVGADDYLTKPFQSIRQLVSKVSALLSGKSARDETPTKELDKPVAGQDAGAKAEPSSSLSATLPPGSEFTSEDGIDAFADPSLDDGMIEATPVGAYNMDATLGGKGRATTPLNLGDVEEAKAELSPSSPIHTQDTLRMRTGLELGNNAIQSSPVLTQPSNAGRVYAADDALLDLGDDEPQLSSGREDDSVLDIWDDAPPPVSSTATTTVEEPIVEYHGDVTEVEAPDIDDENSVGFETAPLVDVTPIPDAASETLSVDPMSEPGAARQPSAGMITLEQVSPEVIDAIARRAVEQLSEKVVEQIAWDVVPELAERLIKRRLEEERKQ